MFKYKLLYLIITYRWNIFFIMPSFHFLFFLFFLTIFQMGFPYSGMRNQINVFYLFIYLDLCCHGLPWGDLDQWLVYLWAPHKKQSDNGARAHVLVRPIRGSCRCPLLRCWKQTAVTPRCRQDETDWTIVSQKLFFFLRMSRCLKTATDV